MVNSLLIVRLWLCGLGRGKLTDSLTGRKEEVWEGFAEGTCPVNLAGLWCGDSESLQIFYSWCLVCWRQTES